MPTCTLPPGVQPQALDGGLPAGGTGRKRCREKLRAGGLCVLRTGRSSWCPLLPSLLPGGSPLPVLEGHGMGDAPESLAYVRSWTLALELGHRVNFCCCDCGPQYPLWEMAWQGFLALRWL